MLKIIVNKELLLDLIYVSILASIISSQTIQKIKEMFNLPSIFNSIMALFLSFIIGFCFAISFYSVNLLYAVWIGLFTLIGAEGLYKTFRGYFGLGSSNELDNLTKKE